jgi:cytidylate kinase
LLAPPLANTLIGQTTIKNENLTNSFVLKEKGLEKLDGSFLQKKDANIDSQNSIEQSKYVEDKPLVSPSKKTNFLRVPSKQISPIVDNANYQIDVKSINIRTMNDKK